MEGLGTALGYIGVMLLVDHCRSSLDRSWLHRRSVADTPGPLAVPTRHCAAAMPTVWVSAQCSVEVDGEVDDGLVLECDIVTCTVQVRAMLAALRMELRKHGLERPLMASW